MDSQVCSFFMQIMKTDQTLQLGSLIWNFVGCMSEGTFSHIVAHTIFTLSTGIGQTDLSKECRPRSDAAECGI